MLKITAAEYEQFLKHLAWTRLQAPDYRFGQAFLNYFPTIRDMMENSGNQGSQDAAHLFYEEWEPTARSRCELWVEK